MPSGPVVVTRAVLERVELEARRAYERDEEACGFLTGPAQRPLFCDEVNPLENLANRYHALDPEAYPRTGRTYFLIDPMKFARGVEAGKNNGGPVRILYHSHLDVGAYFSETDAQAATMGGDRPSYEELLYLVTSVRNGVVDDHKLFAFSDAEKKFVPIDMNVEA